MKICFFIVFFFQIYFAQRWTSIKVFIFTCKLRLFSWALLNVCQKLFKFVAYSVGTWLMHEFFLLFNKLKWVFVCVLLRSKKNNTVKRMSNENILQILFPHINDVLKNGEYFVMTWFIWICLYFTVHCYSSIRWFYLNFFQGIQFKNRYLSMIQRYWCFGKWLYF